MGEQDKLIVPNRRILEAWRLSALGAQPPALGQFNWPQVVLSLITALEQRQPPVAGSGTCYCPDCGTLHVIAGGDVSSPYDCRREVLARLLAASIMGLVKDPAGINLPDEVWQQLLAKADAILFIISNKDTPDHLSAGEALFSELKKW